MSSKERKNFDKILIKPGWTFHSGKLRSKVSPQSIDVKSVTRQMDYKIWELVPVKFISKIHLMKVIQRKLRIFLGAQCHQQVLIH